VSRIKTLGKESVVYGLSGIISKFIGFILLPFFARTLSVEDYGDISILQSYFFFISVVSMLGLDSAFLRWYYDSEDLDNKKGIFSTALLSIQSLSFFWAVITLLLAYLKVLPKLHQENSFLLFGLVAVNISLNWVNSMFVAWCRIQHKAWLTLFFSVTTVFISGVASFILVVTLKQGVFGFIGGQTVAFVATYIIALVILRGWIKFRVDVNLLKGMLRYGLAIMPASLATSATVLVSNILLSHITSQQELGYYQMGLNFGMLVTLITNAFAQSWQPFSFSTMYDRESGTIFNRITVLYTVVLTFMCVCLGFFSPEIIELIASPKFLPSAPLAGIIAFAYFVNSLGTIAITGMLIKKKVGWYSPAVILGSTITILCTAYLTPKLGRFGLAYSLLIGYSAVPAILFYRSQKLSPIPYDFKKIFAVLIIGLLMILYNNFEVPPFYIRVIIAFVLGISAFWSVRNSVFSKYFLQLGK
jgi:O-antigen/teichoic acid export membrane protein